MATQPAVAAGAPAAPGYFEKLQELFRRRETIRFLVRSSLEAGDRDKVLGRIWSLLDPILFMLVYLVVFGYSFRQIKTSPTEFVVYLLCGVLSWRFFESAIIQATGCIRSNRGLIHEINFPKAVFPTSVCLSKLSDFFWGLIVLFAVVICFHPMSISPQMAWLPVVVGIQLLFTLGACFVVAVFGAYFADTANIVAAVMKFWFYFSPVFYRIPKSNGGAVPDDYIWLYMLNPIACFFEAYRNCLLRGEAPNLNQLAYTLAISIALFFGGFAVFIRGEGQFAKYV